jgi:hypothetical protein
VFVELLLLVVSEGMWRGAVRRVFRVLDWAWWYGLYCGCDCMFPVVLWWGRCGAFFFSFSGLSFFGIDYGFPFSRGDIVSG